VPAGRRLTATAFARRIAAAEGGRAPAPPVDLLVRTGGEQRLSDFLLWESAWAELVFTPVMWPDYTADDLKAAVDEFGHRDRRFGGLPEREAS
jgi:undecaprenyl diphosphate synthase